MNQNRYILALHRRLNLTRPRYEKLNQFFAGNWQKAYQASLKDWHAAGLDKRSIERFFGGKELHSPSNEEALLQACGACVLTMENTHFPPLWHNIAQPPALVFYRGDVENFTRKYVSVVGSRRMTDYGRRTLKALVAPVAQSGIGIASGMAFGVDAAAHQLSIESGQPTIAVLGNGIDILYPRMNEPLGKKILETSGTIVSEYLPGTEPRAEYFPQRNRLVAGLSPATVVIEAELKSGSLITARLANEFGREVWAVPGDVFSQSSAGCNQLISQGEASPLLRPELLTQTLNPQGKNYSHQIDLTDLEKEIVRLLQRKSMWDLDAFVSACETPAPETNATLTMLELKGVVGKQGSRLFLY